MKQLLLAIFVLIGLQSSMPDLKNGNVVIVVEGLEKVEGRIAAMIFNQEEGFPEDSASAYASLEVEVINERPVLIFSDLPHGKYAVSLIHDVNGNRNLDKNFIGIPTEPFGFSNNKSIISGLPKFRDAAFELSTDTFESTIKLIEIF